MFEMRMLLEDKVLGLAIPNMTEDTFARAERICQESIKPASPGRGHSFVHSTERTWPSHAPPSVSHHSSASPPASA
ncbi:hypothetical protein PS903_03824 [Pseudomonas fluorescens]|nr:hypothetical protein PS903_03824 [Pseudomonas fluorescens]